jgi:hypothetical protein
MLPFWPSGRLRVSESDGEVLLDGCISSLLDQFWTIMPSITTSLPFLLGYCEIAGILLDQDECSYQILARAPSSHSSVIVSKSMYRTL